MPEISVIMLTYNREKLLERSIKSILNQTFADFEYIIVDNGSTDGSGAICDAWAKKDNRIRVVHRKKGNIGAGRNTGLALASGKYVTFVDDDDRFESDMLEFLYLLAEKNQADISICGAVRESEGQITPKFVYDKEMVLDKVQGLYELLRREYYSSGFPTKLIKREVFEGICFPENVKYEDIYVCYKCFANANKVAVKGEPKYYCYRHVGNNSDFTTNDTLLKKDQLQAYLRAFSERTQYLSEKIPQEAPYYRYTEWSYMISMCHKLLATNNLECKNIFDEMKTQIMENIDEIEKGAYTQDFEKQWLKEIKEKNL